MFGIVSNDSLYFRVDDHNRAVFEKAEDSVGPLEPKGSVGRERLHGAGSRRRENEKRRENQAHPT